MSSKTNIASNSGLILGYNNFYLTPFNGDRLTLIKNISKVSLLAELAACNYRIKSPRNIFFEYEISEQITEIRRNLSFNPIFLNHFENAYKEHLKNTSPNCIIFSRPTLLFALNEIIENEVIKDIDNYNFTGLDQENIIKYLLLVNDKITFVKEQIFTNSNYNDYEKFNLQFLPLNEYFVPIDPLLIFYRGGKLFTYLMTTAYKVNLEKYIYDNSGFEPQRFVYALASIFLHKAKEKSDFNIFYKLRENDENTKLLDFLSTRNSLKPKNELELLNIRKSPLYKAKESNYFLLDNMFILQKSYDFFIWDFLYDYLLKEVHEPKEREKIIQNFKSTLGLFFQDYLDEIINNSFKHKKFTIKTFDNLKIKKTKEEYELADVYIRSNYKILIGQAKTTSVINKEKYADNLDEFYKKNPDKFFEKHGLFQLINSITNLLIDGSIIDKGLPQKRLKIYPIIIYNDYLLSSPFFNQVFNDRFNLLINDLKINSAKIYPLTLIHISDIEILEYYLGVNKIDIFKVLNIHFNKFGYQLPFYRTANNFQYRKYSQRIINYYHKLIEEFKKTQ